MSGKTKYKVGDVFHGTKKIVEYCGSHPRHRVSMWKWECLGCGTIHGPSMTATLTRKDREDSLPRCCMLRGRAAGNWKGYEEISGIWLGQYKYGAQKRNLEWNVTPEYLWELWLKQNCRCAYTGRVLVHGASASLDRTDNSQGYVPGNVKWVHRDVNRMKSNFTQSEFIDICKEVAEQYAR